MSFIEQLNSYSPVSIMPFNKEALEKARSLGVPTKKSEDWKYTNLEKHLPELDLQNQAADDISRGELDQNFSHIFFTNGVLQTELSDFPLEKLDEKNEAKFASFKKSLGDIFENEFTFLMSEISAANQYMLELEGVQEKPLHIHHYYSGKKAKHASAHLHVLGKTNSESHIVETHVSQDESENFANNSASFYLQANSNVSFVKVQAMNKESSNVQNTRAVVSRDANFESITVDVGAKLSRNNISIRLNEEGANCAAHGLYALANDQHCDTNSYIRHAKGHTDSAQLYKGIMADKAHGIFSGVIRMDRDAQLCGSEQLNKNLLLSKGAHAHSRPQLEIFADDVKAAHGSTTGQLSDEELFYFQARGVSADKARKLLAQAFLNDVLFKIKNMNIRGLAQDMVSENFKALTAE